MPLNIAEVDAYTDKPFAGNPAAVCLLPQAREASWMQSVAREMNLAETAFLVRHADAFQLRWFTPTVEVDLCGHATLASAHALWEEGHLPPGGQERLRLHRRAGVGRRRAGVTAQSFAAQEDSGSRRDRHQPRGRLRFHFPFLRAGIGN